MDGNEGTSTAATTPARRRRGGRRSSTAGDGSAAKSGGRKRAPDVLADFSKSVRETLASRIGGFGAADAVLGSGHFDQTLRSFHAMRGSVGAADDKCADVLIDVLATERAEQLQRGIRVPADVAAGQRQMFDSVPSRPASDAEVTDAVAGR